MIFLEGGINQGFTVDPYDLLEDPKNNNNTIDKDRDEEGGILNIDDEEEIFKNLDANENNLIIDSDDE